MHPVLKSTLNLPKIGTFKCIQNKCIHIYNIIVDTVKAVIVFLFFNSNAALGCPSRGLYALRGELLTSSIGLRLMPIQEPFQSSSLRFLLCVKNPNRQRSSQIRSEHEEEKDGGLILSPRFA